MKEESQIEEMRAALREARERAEVRRRAARAEAVQDDPAAQSPPSARPALRLLAQPTAAPPLVRDKQRAVLMASGTVKWFSNEKGYGFITPSDGGADIFVHHSGIVGSGFKTLAEGAKVEYEVVQGLRGLQATNVVQLRS